ncbi:P-loop containing nucleoside triphosphate hydrolase protein [Entophlyctis helioformis]|nr:P-loop containing nucleoside triphosphate hydrolase protein [Entophlyctis helioformis]
MPTLPSEPSLSWSLPVAGFAQGDRDDHFVVLPASHAASTPKRLAFVWVSASDASDTGDTGDAGNACNAASPAAPRLPVHVRYSTSTSASARSSALVSAPLSAALWPSQKAASISTSDPNRRITVSALDPSNISVAASVSLSIQPSPSPARLASLNKFHRILSLMLAGRLVVPGMVISVQWIDNQYVRLRVESVDPVQPASALALASGPDPAADSAADPAADPVSQSQPPPQAAFRISGDSIMSVTLAPRRSNAAPPAHHHASTLILPGLEHAVDALAQRITHMINTASNAASAGTQQQLDTRAVLVTGAPGSGKSHVVRAVAEASGLPWIALESMHFVSSREGDFEHLFLDALEHQCRHLQTPSIVILDNFETLIDAGTVGIAHLVRKLFDRETGTSDNRGAVILMAVTSNELQVKAALGSSAAFFQDFSMPPMSVPDRAALIQHFVNRALSTHHSHCMACWLWQLICTTLEIDDCADTSNATEADQVMSLSKQFRSYVLSDIIGALQQSLMFAATRQDVIQHLRAFVKSTPPSGLRGIASNPPNADLKDLFGIDGAIAQIRELVISPFLNYTQDAARDGRVGQGKRINAPEPPRGVLIHGPHGVGKTVLACALASELGFPCIFVDGPSIRSKVVGDSEKAIARLFERARASAPCILLIDQIEHLLSKRSKQASSEGTSNRVVTSFLIEMDGVIKRTAPICVLATSRSVDGIDAAVLRPGRLDAHISLTLPDAECRRAILAGTLARMPNQLSAADLDRLVDMTLAQSHADVVGLCREAAMAAIRTGSKTVQLADFEAAKRPSGRSMPAT